MDWLREFLARWTRVDGTPQAAQQRAIALQARVLIDRDRLLVEELNRFAHLRSTTFLPEAGPAARDQMLILEGRRQVMLHLYNLADVDPARFVEQVQTGE